MRSSLSVAVLFTALLWVIHSAAVLFNLDQHALGIIPQSINRLHGLITGALVHGGYEHLFNNSLPMIVLMTMLWYGYPNSRFKVFSVVWLLSGVGVWLFARDATHLGASGLTHGLFFFLFTVGIFRRDKRSVALMMIAFFMYGGMVMTIFPREPGISYEYHFFGALAGVIAAVVWHRSDPRPVIQRYEWESDASDEELALEADDDIGDALRGDRRVVDESQRKSE
ncbi:rhomboid family intramembrane serine protease [Alteromonas oceanisediminis]|uniref:rhomboid family intramembrane serine protease n=1 Tax=Alteromonas oceanisediminis TaxID=2836180 RepID=UPI001BD966F6|nr:rhomboid family intramembrane serine protease [Alteromonas oceanisediminis]MBT0587148.1 rhomboid family intramembrane serine protease [Alteromonas oceanisediminis]